ncbi:hypothetical protein [Marinobacter sp. S6332]|uniref:hypothetical protein n=1 Tax=Marinobacter sp. S6332 TaxID=2926403 RepID=UPI001FF6B3C5|nr:hypothetical protein [Marinobacter sp. S6332]MCK0165754.1 hypothetical protein [Marinobacter sp. S6332]
METTIEITFGARETLPVMIRNQARLLGLTDAEFAKRLIVEGMERLVADSEPSKPGKTLEDFLVRNGALYPRE